MNIGKFWNFGLLRILLHLWWLLLKVVYRNFIFVGAKDKLLTSETVNTLNLLSLAKQNKHCTKSKKYVPNITLHKSYDFLEGPGQVEELIEAKKLNLCLSD